MHIVIGKRWSLLLALILCVPALGRAGVIYEFTGAVFNSPPNASDSPYVGKNITGSFSVDQNLVSCESCHLTDPQYDLQYDFADGVGDTYDQSGVTQFTVTTGILGDVEAWSITFSDPCIAGAIRCALETFGPQGSNTAFYELSDGTTPMGITLAGTNGTWQCKSDVGTGKVGPCLSSAVPEPGSLSLVLLSVCFAVAGAAMTARPPRTMRPLQTC